MSEETKPQKPFPQFIDKNPRKHFHWAMFLIVSLGLAAALLIVIENFKTAEEIDSMAPVFKKKPEEFITKKQSATPPEALREMTWEEARQIPNILPKFCVGDANEDGKVDEFDLNIVKKAIGTEVGKQGFERRADIDFSGIVNSLDLEFVQKNLGCKKP